MGNQWAPSGLFCALNQQNIKESANVSGKTTDNPMFVISLDIDPLGQVKARIPDLEKSAQLHNTLLQGLFPDIRVARLNVPGGILEEAQQALVEQAMKRVELGGVQFKLVGASGSAKDGKFYAVEAKYERAIAQRFMNWPQAAITYFGVLVSPCKVRIEASDVRVIVVKDHEFGTNDCRGWISRSIFRALQERSRANGRVRARPAIQKKKRAVELPSALDDAV